MATLSLYYKDTCRDVSKQTCNFCNKYKLVLDLNSEVPTYHLNLESIIATVAIFAKRCSYISTDLQFIPVVRKLVEDLEIFYRNGHDNIPRGTEFLICTLEI